MIKTPWAAVSAASIWWLHVWVVQNLPGGAWVLGLYTSLIVSGFAMVTLMRLDVRELTPWMVKTDRFFGNLSHPMYLCHWGVGIVVSGLLHGSCDHLSVFLISFPLINLACYLLYTRVEHPLQSWKLTSRVRSRPRAFARNRQRDTARWCALRSARCLEFTNPSDNPQRARTARSEWNRESVVVDRDSSRSRLRPAIAPSPSRDGARRQQNLANSFPRSCACHS